MNEWRNEGPSAALLLEMCTSTAGVSPQGSLAGQHVSAPALSMSQAVISTYHSDQAVTENTGSHNPHAGAASAALPRSALCCFIVLLWLTTATSTNSVFLHRASPIATKRFWGFSDYDETREKTLLNCWVCWTSAPSSPMWYDEGNYENKEINLGELWGNTLVKNQNLALGS